MRTKRLSAKAEALRGLSLFAACTNRELELAASLVDEVSRPAGITLTEQGHVGRECFVIASGDVAVELNGERIATLGAGDVVGEMALLDHAPRSASVVTLTPVELLVLTPGALTRLVEETPVARSMLRGLVERLRTAQGAPAW